MEDNLYTRNMLHFHPGKEIFEIFYDLDGNYHNVYVVQYEEKFVTEAIIKPKELLIKEETISIKFSYPLDNKVRFEYNNKDGFTRLDLFRCIYEGYKNIYETEEKEVGDPGIGEMSYNRKQSKGKYGIWGHYMNDLRIEGIVYDSKERLIELSIGS